MTLDARRRLALTFLTVLSRPDAEKVGSVIVDDFVWSFPGKSQISGEARGVDGVMTRARTIASYGVKVEILDVVYASSGVGAILHNNGSKDGRILDEQVVAIFTLDGDKLSRLDTHLSNVPMADAFFG